MTIHPTYKRGRSCRQNVTTVTISSFSDGFPALLSIKQYLCVQPRRQPLKHTFSLVVQHQHLTHTHACTSTQECVVVI